MKARPDVVLDVVVLTHNTFATKGGCLAHTLLCLANQSLKNISVVVVDNGSRSEDRARAGSLVEGLQRKNIFTNLLYISTDTSISSARNIGASHGRSGTLLFMDDDCLLHDADALTVTIEAAQAHSHGYGARRMWTPPWPWFEINSDFLRRQAASGAPIPNPRTWTEPMATIRRAKITRILTRSFIGHFGFIQRTLFARVGGFPESFTGYGAEDDALSFLAFLTCPKFVRLDGVTVTHVNHPIENKCFQQLQHNEILYQQLLRNRGVKHFHIGKLLFSIPDEWAPDKVITCI